MSKKSNKMAEPKATKMDFNSAFQRTPSVIFHVKQSMEDFYLSDDTLEQITKQMEEEMVKGLGKDTNESAKVKMLPSFVQALADGSENGTFLALDLGGTNFRVLLVKLEHGEKPEMDSQIYKMPEEVITGSGEKLFDHIAQCMAEFLTRLNMKHVKLPVGFTFSFPCQQDRIDTARLISWTKGFSAEGVEGMDVVSLLREAIDRRGDIKVAIIAVVNDTVGTLMSCAYDIRDCMAGLIVGTGSNCCYMEKMKNVELLPGDEGDMCINMEWGAFGDDGALDIIRNGYDREVDCASLNKGKQLYEKMISGMYMGELVRLVLCKLTDDKVLFDGVASESLKTHGKFETAFVSQIERNVPNGYTALQNILHNLGLGALHSDCEIVEYVCEAVSTRAAYLCAAGIAAIARKIRANYPEKEELEFTVGVDGTVYRKHPTFAKNMAHKVGQLTEGRGINVKFALSYDGSGKGAALITAVAARLHMEKGKGEIVGR
uniref:hexokinase-2-like n=1 Tax=Styela clava TaxID=7725 RepID=UPI0019397815|nr:hexokinase-2-like [Styela clava]